MLLPMYNAAEDPFASIEFRTRGVWLDSAYYHPISVGAGNAMRAYRMSRQGLANRELVHSRSMQQRVRGNFAKLIGASDEEIAFVPSATVAENLLIQALRLGPGSRIVTDALHFRGSLQIYSGMAGRGIDVEVLPERGGGVALDQVARALETPTALLALSSVSQVNGYAPDLTRICELARARDTLVYADVTQHVGAIPLDVRTSKVDFCGTSAYKWLMGDMGIGFLYVRKDRLDGLAAPLFGARQAEDDGNMTGPTGRKFEAGTMALAALAALDFSLERIIEISCSAIAQHRRRLLRTLRQEAQHLGFQPLTPSGSQGPLQVFGNPHGARLESALKRSGVFVSTFGDRFRVAPSIFNTATDIEVLVDILRKVGR